MEQLANRSAITGMTTSRHASEIGVVNGGQAMDQFDKAATLIVHHQPRQRTFAGAGRFLTEIRAQNGDVLNSQHISSRKGDISMTITRKTSMDHTNTASTQAHDYRIRTSAANVGRFSLHLLEMLLAMMAGMPILYLLGNLIPASSSYAAAFQSGTNLSALAMGVFMTVPMVAWMIVRGHGWRHGAEMAFAMFAPVAAIIALRLLGADASLPWLAKASHPAMPLAMIIAMLYRRDHYTLKAGHAAHTAHRAIS